MKLVYVCDKGLTLTDGKLSRHIRAVVEGTMDEIGALADKVADSSEERGFDYIGNNYLSCIVPHKDKTNLLCFRMTHMIELGFRVPGDDISEALCEVSGYIQHIFE